METLIKLLEPFRVPVDLFGARDKSLEELHRLLDGKLKIYLFGRVHSSDLEDALQNTWKALIVAIPTFKGTSDPQFLKFCYTIARRRASDMRSFREKMDTLPIDEITQKIDESDKLESLSAQDRIDLTEALNMLSKSKPKCREVLWNHFVIGFDISEIAEQNNLTYDAARMTLNRCLNFARAAI